MEFDLERYKNPIARSNSKYFPFNMKTKLETMSHDSDKSQLDSTKLEKKPIQNNSSLLQRKSTVVKNNHTLAEISKSVISQQVRLKEILDRSNQKMKDLQVEKKLNPKLIKKHKRNYTNFRNADVSSFVLKKLQHRDIKLPEYKKTNIFRDRLSKDTNLLDSNIQNSFKNENSLVSILSALAPRAPLLQVTTRQVRTPQS